MRLGQRFTLPDGRSLGYDEYGSENGRPVFYFHGTPSSRLDLSIFSDNDTIEKLGVRIIAVDRPGCGLSDYQKKRKISDWPKDISALADDLGLDRFAVMGWSGGGPYALACARFLPDRVSATAVVSCMGPHEVPGLYYDVNSPIMKFLKVNKKWPIIGTIIDRMFIFGANSSPDKFMRKTLAVLPAVDRDLMSIPEITRKYIGTLNECFRTGFRGCQKDAALMIGPWDFDLKEIKVPVHLWHGEQDVQSPSVMGRWIANNLSDCRAEFFPEEGHISLLANHFKTIVSCLVV